MPIMSKLALKFSNIIYYKQLMRTDKVIGSLLLLWPTYWALWLSSGGIPDILLLCVFTAGVFVMRSAGCVINDFADRKVDGYVARTKNRPLVTGKVTSIEAIQLFILLITIAFLLVLLLNLETIILSVGGLLLAFCYPFMKRFTYLPQVVLGAAYSWCIPMSYMAIQKTVPAEAWLLYIANLFWTVAYDTMYAMVDREDDKKVGIKSSAILFADFDKFIIGLLQSVTLGIIVYVAIQHHFTYLFYSAFTIAIGLFIYQHWLIKNRDREQCFKAFLNNHWVGLVLFSGIALELQLS